MSRGFFLMHRGWMDSPDFQPEPFTEREAFIWSIEQAAHTPHPQWFNGVQIEVGRGEFATSSRKLAQAFRWGEKRARLFMARMERRGKWALRAAQEGAHVATILSVCNYERFQTLAKPEGAPEDAGEGAPAPHPGRTEGAQQNEGLINGDEGKGRERAPALPYAEAVEAWRDVAPALKWTPANPTLGDKRRRGLSTILNKYGLAGWREGIARAATSEVLGGHDPPDWFNFDFIVKPDNFLKVRDGNYDKQFSDHRQQQSTGWGDAYFASRGGMSV